VSSPPDAALYAFFDNTDCIFIDILGMNEEDCKGREWGAFAFKRILGINGYGFGDELSMAPRYFILGNCEVGYSGIEREMGVPCFWNENDQLCWAFRYLYERAAMSKDTGRDSL
jgi:hypothetical protein